VADVTEPKVAGTARGLVTGPAGRGEPVLSRARFGRWFQSQLTDERIIAVLAAALSISFYVWYDRHGLTLAFNDARIREMIARRVLASRTPGLAQFGTTWLPLSFVIMLPLMWNDTLFRDGLAGSLPSMAAFVLAAVYMYRLARQVTFSRTAGWVAAGVLMTNGSLLYIQATAMSETASLCALVVTVYYALRVAKTHHALDLVKCAAAAVAGTLIRYENWAFAVALVPLFAYIGWRRGRGYVLAESWVLLYGLLAFAGCAAWVLYNGVIFHDPLLSFFYGNSSSALAATSVTLYPVAHHPLGAARLYGITAGETLGWIISVTAVAGLALFAWQQRLRERTLPVYILLIPLPFYWVVLYLGINTEYLPQTGDGYYNVRFGLLMIPAAALFVAFLAVQGGALARRLLTCGVVAAVVAAGVVASSGTPLVLLEAKYGPAGAPSAQGAAANADWLSSHYRGGNVLITYVNSPTMMFYMLTRDRFPDRALVTDANGPQFDAALAAPQRWVTWVVMDSNADNGVSQIWAALHTRTDWRKYFVLRRTSGSTQIYERRASVAAGPS
jgi:hypothetical protein